VLSPQTQTNLKNAKTYFEEHLAVGDYLAEAECVVGQWIGKRAELLGLVGAVAQRDFVALCENNDLLTQRLKTTRTVDGGTDHEHQAANRRVFYDFTFSPPKSVSIAALVNDDAKIVQAHREAVRIAATDLEEFAALFEMLVAQKYVENVYYHELARALQACGYTIKNSARGDFRVGGISPELIVRFQSGIARLMTTPGSSWQSIPRRATAASTTFASIWRTDFALAR